jgi:hypothetical protein
MNKPSVPKHAQDNRANQLNPEHLAYRRSRGLEDPPPEGETSKTKPKDYPPDPESI